VNLTHIKRHYYESHPTINPTGIVPLGPDLDFATPNDRARRCAVGPADGPCDADVMPRTLDGGRSAPSSAPNRRMPDTP
jgi:hypothetical protein